MRMLRFARAAGAAFALVLFGAAFGMAAVSPYWQGQTPGSTGAWLGDSTFNINSLWRAHVTGAGMSYTSLTTISQTSAQANCTQINPDAMVEAKTSAATGYLCLPSAVAGKVVMIGNASGQTIDLYSSATPGVPGGATDTINGTAGTTAYTSMSSGKNTVCFAANNGAWYCITV